ncbi:LLM class flavin-dependent oxidoreductase [Nocardioides sp. SOB44]|uniref:LLM class flavin-dependent oxidoreductase n=1 Tax=Nocardioides cremeus TaxID=3058044 RepID=A0ABT8TTP3_9ACTN|nr:LLM class flavin-dependent oxidoreductase [Nocardioides cremeus]MDO3395866.1 LLM class flavin-dependent oxidoreductase [Nocardioides cremeus]
MSTPPADLPDALQRLGTRARPTFGLDTFGDLELGPDGRAVHEAEAIRQVVAEGVLADRVGVDYLGLGEHHRDDYAISAPDVVLAAIAGQTSRLRLGTGVTVLSSDDPIRVFQRFSTLAAISGGRAEVQLGRGSFTESFALFGHDLSDYEVLFHEKLDLFAAVQSEQPVTWSGTIRPPLREQVVHPRTEAGLLPAWIAVGGTPQSVVRAAAYGMPLVLAVIGGSPAGFTQLADLYRRALVEYERPELPIGMHSPGHVAATDELAREQMFPHQAAAFTRIGRERGWGPYTREAFEQGAGEQGALFVGSPETVARKIAWAVRTLGLSRFQMKYAVGALPHAQRLESIRLYGTEVIPRVRELLAQERA